MRQIRNNTLSGITFNVNDFHSIRLLPGINLLNAEDFDFIRSHPISKIYQELNQLAFDEVNVSEMLFDEELNLKVVTDEFGEDIPVFQVDSANNVSIPGDPLGRFFKVKDYKNAGLGAEIAKVINTRTPKSGWFNSDQVLNIVQESFPALSEDDRLKVSKLFD
jgi:hypothetical protein